MCRTAGVAGMAFWVSFLLNSAIAEETPKLRYGVQKDQKFAYDILINLKCMSLEETWKGILVFEVTKAADDQFGMKVTGRLAESVQGGGPFPHFPGRHRMPFGPHGPFGPFGVRTPDTWTISRRGDVVVMGRVTQIPCLLGPEELLIIESLPKEAKSSWTVSSGTGITEVGESPMPFPPRREEVGHGAGEQVDYAITKTTPEIVHLTKKYHLSTTPSSGDETHFNMSGSGEIEFDRKRGVFSSNSMKYDIEVNKNNTKLNVPVTLTYHLMTEKEFADYQKKEKEKADAIAEANKPKPINAQERASLLKDLRSRDDARAQAALQRLGKAVVDGQPDAISAAVAPFLSHPNTWIQADAAKAMMIWATPNAEAALIKASSTENWMARGSAIIALGRIPSPAAAEAAAAELPRTRGEAGQALRAMGRVAETATIPLAADHDHWVRGEAINVLKEIGGRKSIAALQRALRDPHCHDKRQIEDAIAAIEVHVAQQGGEAEPAEAATTKPAAAKAKDKPRTWSDATGSFQVEALFLGVAEGKVSLKKTDGRTIHVPLEKLSEEDQIWVKDHAQPKAENPFE
jgi:HEAT repeat protein